QPPPYPAAAKSLAWIAFADILVFFGVLLVGFAYLWRRGDLKWVRSTAAQCEPGALATGGGARRGTCRLNGRRVHGDEPGVGDQLGSRIVAVADDVRSGVLR